MKKEGLVAHGEAVARLAIAFFMVMIESPGARIVLAVCICLGLIFAGVLRLLANRRPQVPSIFASKSIIQ